MSLATSPVRRGLHAVRLAEMYEELGQVDEAAQHNRRAIDEYRLALTLTSRNESKADYWAAIAASYERLGEKSEARVALEEAIELLPQGSEQRAEYESQLEQLD
jgi:Flp pilus assembly protein TadD